MHVSRTLAKTSNIFLVVFPILLPSDGITGNIKFMYSYNIYTQAVFVLQVFLFPISLLKTANMPSSLIFSFIKPFYIFYCDMKI